ncbi:hypothetical protein [Alteromonas sp. 14N.309.X.WAT.G.H12]|uniref:hypothetical protein n=1 Tax=Alteromonas sp. 14N.309.X.WAT.G.H12 TaxID=3120824 RepID=UPI002FD09EDE
MNQDVSRLSAWFERFPDACKALELGLSDSCLKYAMAENLWLSTVFLLQCDSVPRKTLQIQTGVDNPQILCRHLIKAHIQNSPSSRDYIARSLYELVRL